MILRTPILCILSFLFLRCVSSIENFHSFESEKWKADGKKCTSYRQSVIKEMESEFDKLLGLNENEVVQVLGKPEETHLYRRGQKFIYYRIQCKENIEKTDKLKIRFSALGLSNEVLILK